LGGCGRTLEQAVQKAGQKAEKHVAEELGVSSKDLGNAIQEAATEVDRPAAAYRKEERVITYTTSGNAALSAGGCVVALGLVVAASSGGGGTGAPCGVSVAATPRRRTKSASLRASALRSPRVSAYFIGCTTMTASTRSHRSDLSHND
jgi:hypothetical protein